MLNFFNSGSNWDRPNDLRDILVDKAYFPFIKKMVQFYIKDIKPDFNVENKLSKTQQILYGLEIF